MSDTTTSYYGYEPDAPEATLIAADEWLAEHRVSPSWQLIKSLHDHLERQLRSNPN